MNNPICFALDGMDENRARKFVDDLEPHVGAFKVGLELFINCGRLPRTSKPVILDLKLHDIPETVANAVKAGAGLGAKYMTLHVQQRATLEKALRAADEVDVTLLGVTVLTSMTVQDFKDLDYDWDEDGDLRGVSVEAFRVRRLVMHGLSCGLRGFVCSPQEAKMVRKLAPTSFLLVPGIRPVGAVLDDQKRVGTPRQAVQDGASLIVIGRPIRDAEDPVRAAQDILGVIQAGI